MNNFDRYQYGSAGVGGMPKTSRKHDNDGANVGWPGAEKLKKNCFHESGCAAKKLNQTVKKLYQDLGYGFFRYGK